VTVGGLAMSQALLPRYAQAQTISFTDERQGPVRDLPVAGRHLRHHEGIRGAARIAGPKQAVADPEPALMDVG